MNTPVTFETAKLLKEKGFDEACTHHLLDDKSIVNFGSKRTCKAILEDLDEGTKLLPIPTIAEVVMWLYEKHGIWFSVIDKNTDQTEWEFQTSKKGIGLVFSSGQYPPKFYNSPTEAYEAAIEYTLRNLI